MSDQDLFLTKLKKVARIIIKAGVLPFAASDTFLELLKFYLDEEDVEFILNFKHRSSMNTEQLKKNSRLSEEEIKRKAEKLARKGFIFNQPSSSGIIVYRLLPIIVIGTFEYTFMNGIPEGEETKKYKGLAQLYAKLIDEFTNSVQKEYDNLIPVFKNQPPFGRAVPVFENSDGEQIEIVINQELDVEQTVLPSQKVEEIINKFDDIAVGNCFCRNYHRLLDEPCEINAPLECCFTFGKSARHVIEHGFGKKIDKKEALKIMRDAEEAGLIHMAFHNGLDIYREENSVCNCCKCCSDSFNLWRKGAVPLIYSTNYLSMIKQEVCIGCGTCVEKCPIDAIELNDESKAERNEEYCIGCGICSRFCPEGAISLKKGMRRVYVPPPRLNYN